jgi:hypothetical protein
MQIKRQITHCLVNVCVSPPRSRVNLSYIISGVQRCRQRSIIFQVVSKARTSSSARRG